MYIPEYLQHVTDWLHQFFTLDPNEPFKTSAKVISMAGTAVTVLTTLATKTYPWLRAKIDSQSVSKSLGASLFTSGSIYRSIRYYIPPNCQSIDPAGNEESRLIHPVQNKLFSTLDNVLAPLSVERYHILLADSGMGKTSALINYYVRHLRRWRKSYKLAVVPLGIPDADEKIESIEDKPNTVLFLDAFDEDTLAMVDHAERLRLLLKLTREFPRVLITCRTQFFTKDEEIPQETGMIKIIDRPAGEEAVYRFIKIYLSPFSDKQVDAYLRRRYPIWHRHKRQRAFQIVKKMPHLTARPMLLAHINTLLSVDREFNYSFQVYEEMVNAWIKREKGFIEETTQLRDFSEILAVDLFLNRSSRGGEFISKPEIKALASKWGINIHEDKLSGRGLLNRDAVGNFKFAHRSIMEYLFVRRFVRGEPRCLNEDWTDQMKSFLWEMIEADDSMNMSNNLPTRLFTGREKDYDYRIRDLFVEMAMQQVSSPNINLENPSSRSFKTLILVLRLILSNNENPVLIEIYKFRGIITTVSLGVFSCFIFNIISPIYLDVRSDSGALNSKCFVLPSTTAITDFSKSQEYIVFYTVDSAYCFKITHENRLEIDVHTIQFNSNLGKGDTIVIPIFRTGGEGIVIYFRGNENQFNVDTLALITRVFPQTGIY